MLYKRGVFAIFLFVMCIFVASGKGFGVSPAKYEINFEPGLEESFTFNYFSDEPETKFEMVIQGDLAEYVTLDVDEYSGSAKVIAILKLPQNIEVPGPHRIFVGSSPLPVTGEGGFAIGITAKVNALITVNVPYPGKYADVDFEIEDANSGEKVPYNLKIYSRGEEDISTFSKVEIYNSENERVGNYDIGVNNIPAGESVEIKSELDVADIGAGNYRAVAIVSYSGGEVEKENFFRLGELSVEILNYTREFERKKINPIHIDILSGWNDPIEGIYATGNVNNYNIEFESPSIRLDPWHKGKLVGYFDTTPIEEEEFMMDLVLYYGEQTTEETINLRFKKKEFNYLLWGGIVLGVVIVLGFVLWIIMKLNKLERKSGKRKKK